MANVTITQLPAAGPITGSELVPIVQNGQTVQTTSSALAGSPVQTQTFLTLNQEPSLNNSRALAGGTGIGLVDGGAQSTLQVTLNGAAGSLEAASNGVIVKTGASTVTNRSIAVSGVGLSIANGSGVCGNPTVALDGLISAVAQVGGTGLLAIQNGATAGGVLIAGTASQISVANGNGQGGNPTLSIASNPVLPGTGAVTIPVGTTAQQPVGADGQIRYNTSTNEYEGYSAGSWQPFCQGGGGGGGCNVTSFSAGSTGFTPSVATSGAVTLAGTLNVANGGTGQTTYANGQLLIGNSTGSTLTKSTLTAGSGISITNGAGSITIAATGGGGGCGTVTSVGLSGGTTGLTASCSPITTAGTITLGGILNIANGGTGEITAQAAMNAFAGAVTSGSYLRGNGTNVVMSSIQVADVPTLNQNTTGTAGNVTGTVAIANGGSGTTTAQGAMNAFAGAVTSGSYLRGNGTNVVMNTIQAGDVPTLNQNTTGTAANVTGTVAVANGGTGQTTYTNGQLLIGNTTGNTLTKATLTAGCGVTITNGAGSITISAAGGGACPATPCSPGIVYGQTTVCCPNGKVSLGFGLAAGNASVQVGYTAITANSAVAVGFSANANTNAVSIGHGSIANSCGSIAIGKSASVGACCITSINTIAIGTNTFGSNNDRTFIGPIRSSAGLQTLYYNACTREVTSDTSIVCATPTVAGKVFGTTCICNSRTALGYNAGLCCQGGSAVAVGDAAGNCNQGSSAVAVGSSAGRTNQQSNAVAIGNSAGFSNQGCQSVAVGQNAGFGSQGDYSVAIGASTGCSQGDFAVAVGYSAGSFGQGCCSVAIGASSSSAASSVAIGAFTASSPSQTHIGPIRNATTCFALYYCPCTREITYG